MSDENAPAAEFKAADKMIMLKEGVFASVKNAKITFDLVDSEGKPIMSGGNVQSPGSLAEFSGVSLSGIGMSGNALCERVFPQSE